MDAIAQAAYEGDAETLAQLVAGVRLPNDFALGVAASAGHAECVLRRTVHGCTEPKETDGIDPGVSVCFKTHQHR